MSHRPDTPVRVLPPYWTGVLQAELPVSITPTVQRRQYFQKKSTRLGAYLYISAHFGLQDEQRAFIADFQGRLQFSEIEAALEFQHQLTTNPRIRARYFGQAPVPVPFLRKRPVRRDQRRIGVGYRDKGSLPKRPRAVWEADNTLNTGEPTAWVTRVWDLTVLLEEPSIDSNEPDEDRRKGKRLPLDRFHLLSEVILSKTSESSWKISLPGDPSQF